MPPTCGPGSRRRRQVEHREVSREGSVDAGDDGEPTAGVEGDAFEPLCDVRDCFGDPGRLGRHVDTRDGVEGWGDCQT